MSITNLGRVQGGSIFYSTSESKGIVEKSTLTPTNISPLVGDMVLFPNGDLKEIMQIPSGATTVACMLLTNIKGKDGVCLSGKIGLPDAETDFATVTLDQADITEEHLQNLPLGTLLTLTVDCSNKVAINSVGYGTPIVFHIGKDSSKHRLYFPDGSGTDWTSIWQGETAIFYLAEKTSTWDRWFLISPKTLVNRVLFSGKQELSTDSFPVLQPFYEHLKKEPLRTLKITLEDTRQASEDYTSEIEILCSCIEFGRSDIDSSLIAATYRGSFQTSDLEVLFVRFNIEVSRTLSLGTFNRFIIYSQTAITNEASNNVTSQFNIVKIENIKELY